MFGELSFMSTARSGKLGLHTCQHLALALHDSVLPFRLRARVAQRLRNVLSRAAFRSELRAELLDALGCLRVRRPWRSHLGFRPFICSARSFSCHGDTFG